MDQTAAPAGRQEREQRQELSLRVLLQEMLQRGASDLHITVGNPPMMRVDGDLIKSKMGLALTPKDTLALSYSILTENQKKRFEVDDELDFSFGVQNLSRFRGNVYKQRGCVGMAIRQIPYDIITLEKLGMPRSSPSSPNAHEASSWLRGRPVRASRRRSPRWSTRSTGSERVTSSP